MKTFDELFAELSATALERPEGSGTVAQLDRGVHAIGKKIVEEAAEVWMAAEYESNDEAAEEIAASVAYFMADLQDHYPVIRDGAGQLCSVAYADVVSLPDRAPVTATVAKDVAQYNGSFRVLFTP